MAAYKMFFKALVWKDFKSIPDNDLTKIFNIGVSFIRHFLHKF